MRVTKIKVDHTHGHDTRREKERDAERVKDETMITVLYFASAREATEGQIASEHIALPSENKIISVAALKRTLAHKHGKKLAAILETCAVSVAQEYCESDEDVVRSGDEVAIIPPISGG